MIETSARLLALLSLLQMRREWSGAELSDRLEVDVRTVRRDIDKLRGLGYPIQSARGIAGGYRLGAGAELPPLLLDDAEAVAVAVGLRFAAAGSVTGIEEASVRALAKLEQLLPTRLRRRVRALGEVTSAFSFQSEPVDGDLLADVAAAARETTAVRFAYRARDDRASERHAEPSASSTAARAGTCWRGTSNARTGARFAWTGSAVACDPPVPARAGDPGRCRAATRPPMSAAAWRAPVRPPDPRSRPDGCG